MKKQIIAVALTLACLSPFVIFYAISVQNDRAPEASVETTPVTINLIVNPSTGRFDLADTTECASTEPNTSVGPNRPVGPNQSVESNPLAAPETSAAEFDEPIPFLTTLEYFDSTRPDNYLVKLSHLPADAVCTIDLDDLTVYPVKGDNLIASNDTIPYTHADGKEVLGFSEINNGDGTFTLAWVERYTVQPGDTLVGIIEKCGWVPEGMELYGDQGFLARLAEGYGTYLDEDGRGLIFYFDELEDPIYVGQQLVWASPFYRYVDNYVGTTPYGLAAQATFGSGR